MENTITIKLLHERRGSRSFRKIDGRSGTVYVFRWQPEAKAYCYEAKNAEEADDIFHSQGRAMGSYFAPVFPKAKPVEPVQLSDHVTLALLKNDIDMPKTLAAEDVATALVASFEKGVEMGVEKGRLPTKPLEPLSSETAPTLADETKTPEPAATGIEAVTSEPTLSRAERKSIRRAERETQAAAKQQPAVAAA